MPVATNHNEGSTRADTANAPKATRRRSPELKKEFKEQLIGVARRILIEQGADAVTVRSVALAAGVSPMGMYRYFPSKVALISYLWDEILFDVLRHIEEATSQISEPYERLRVGLETSVSFWLKHPDRYRMVYLESGTDPDPSHGVDYWDRALGPYALSEQLLGVMSDCWRQDNVTVTNPQSVLNQLFILHSGLLHCLLVTGLSPLVDVATSRANWIKHAITLVKTAPQWTRE